MFYVDLNEIESIKYRRALNVYHYIITHNKTLERCTKLLNQIH